MVTGESLERARAIQRRTGRTFYLATRLLPERVRHATYVLYAFFRLADDVVDDSDPAPASEQRAELGRLRRGALGRDDTDDAVLQATSDLRDRYDVPDREIAEFIGAMVEDIDHPRYQTVEGLSRYLRGSSVAVAYMVLSVMSTEMSEDDLERARPHARSLGQALQLTNFLRDVREDVLEYDRIYLPRSVLERNGVSDEAVRELEFSPGFANAVREELERTETRYRHGVEGIRYLPEDCRFAVVLAATLYAEHHRLIRNRGYDVLSDRPTLTIRRRILVLVRTWWHWRHTAGDPSRTFDAVTAFESTADRAKRRGDPLASDSGDSTEDNWSPSVLETVRKVIAGRFSE
jgi:phytoene synthase